MTPEEQKTKCEKCSYSEVVSVGNFKFLGCAHKPHKYKWVAEIEKCPKEEKEK